MDKFEGLELMRRQRSMSLSSAQPPLLNGSFFFNFILLDIAFISFGNKFDFIFFKFSENWWVIFLKIESQLSTGPEFSLEFWWVAHDFIPRCWIRLSVGEMTIQGVLKVSLIMSVNLSNCRCLEKSWFPEKWCSNYP